LSRSTSLSTSHAALPIYRADAPHQLPRVAAGPLRPGSVGRLRRGAGEGLGGRPLALGVAPGRPGPAAAAAVRGAAGLPPAGRGRSEEHTSELQSREKLVY